MECPRCQHPHFVKNGHINAKQHSKCKDCDYQWTENHRYTGRPVAEKAFAVFLYCQWNVKVYYTDNSHAYESVLPKDKVVQTKAETNAIERNNCRMHHGFGRFKRKSIIVSKSLEIVNLTGA